MPEVGLAVEYVVGPPPPDAELVSVAQVGDADISRAQVALIVADALRREAYREALVATHLWEGKKRLSGGSGPAVLHRISVAEDLEAVLARAVTALSEHGVEAAYAKLQGRGAWFGPSFYTRFLYFADKTVPPSVGLGPLILDRVLARRLRSLA